MAGGGHCFLCKQTAVGADYLYFLQGRCVGSSYLVAGAGLASNKVGAYFPVARPNWALGLGHQVNANLGVEARYTSCPYYRTSFRTYSVGATLRF